MALIYVAVFISVRFNYWELRPNELLHHHGILGDLKRHSTMHLSVEKDINDIFEFFLLGSGRLILHPQDATRSITLENVLFINQKERAVVDLLGRWDVKPLSAPGHDR
jgi:hypothetical protein